MSRIEIEIKCILCKKKKSKRILKSFQFCVPTYLYISIMHMLFRRSIMNNTLAQNKHTYNIVIPESTYTKKSMLN